MRKPRNYSPTYVTLLEMFLKLQAQAKEQTSYIQSVGSDGIKSRDNGTTQTVQQQIIITDTELFSKCTTGEWYLVGRILSELHLYNALWECTTEEKAKNSTLRRGIKGLIAKNILITTENSSIYLVNPLMVRRGELFQVIATTATALREHIKVHAGLLGNKRAVRNMDITGGDQMLLLEQ